MSSPFHIRVTAIIDTPAVRAQVPMLINPRQVRTVVQHPKGALITLTYKEEIVVEDTIDEIELMMEQVHERQEDAA